MVLPINGKQMNDFLNRITIFQISAVSGISYIVNWLVSNEIVLLLTAFTLAMSAILAVRKAFIEARKDILWAIQKIRGWRKKHKKLY